MKYLSVNRMTTILFVFMITTVLCAGPVVSNALAKEKVWKIKMQLYTVPGKWDCQWVVPKKFAEFVKKHTNGRVDISVHPAGELVGPREIWTAVSAGTIDAGATLSVYEGGTHPEFSYGLGTVYTIEEHYKIMHAGALDILQKRALDENIRIIGYFPLVPYYAVSMKHGFAKTLEDLKGKKIRSMGGVSASFLKKAGAGTVTLPMSEVPAALQTGVVDGIHTGLAGPYAMKLWDVAPYFTANAHGDNDFYILMNEDVYKRLPSDIKEGIAAAQHDLEPWYIGWDKKFREHIVQDSEAKGLKWYFTTPEEDKRWQKLLTEATVEWVMKREPKIGRELYEVVEKVTGRKVLP
ncbi:TRAP transporter substrate-binding protein [bacterium]|nr:TRAP transporter substrate-binding protein [bacterium]